MTVTIFDPDDDLIFVQAYVWDTRGQERKLRLVLDTGAGPTIIASEILDELGYSAREHGEQVASTRSIAGREVGYMLRVKQLECLGVVEASRKEPAERAVRIAAMLDRWAAEDVTSEPEWDVEDLEPMTLRGMTLTAGSFFLRTCCCRSAGTTWAVPAGA